MSKNKNSQQSEAQPNNQTPPIVNEWNHPVPEVKTRTRTVYPFPTMLLGHSFFAPGKTKKQLVGLCYIHGRKCGSKFVCEQRTEEGVDGTRVWRAR